MERRRRVLNLPDPAPSIGALLPELDMTTRRRLITAVAFVTVLSGCATAVSMPSPLVGAWLVSSERSRGVGKNMLTFSSDGTFFRSGDTHPTLSGGHGAWKQVGPGNFEATYIAFRFDESRKWVGSTKTSLRIQLGSTPNEFTGTAKSVTRDLDDRELRAGESNLQARRIEVSQQ